jgi:DNA-binding protein YbaB
MPVFEYPGYDADAALSRQVLERMERLSKALDRLQKGWDSIIVEASGGNGDVELSVDHKGRLMSLSLAEGCTQRYTNLGLEELINTTLRSAVAAAAEEDRAVDESLDADTVDTV